MTISLRQERETLESSVRPRSLSLKRGGLLVFIVYGVDKWSGARETVTALLHKPFTSDDSQNISPKNRWSGHDRPSLTIK
jgi:hypothetical protein